MAVVLPLTSADPRLDVTMRAFALDLLVGAGPRLIALWIGGVDGFVDKPRDSRPDKGFAALIKILNGEPDDLVLFGDRRPDGSRSFVATFMGRRVGLAVRYEDLKHRHLTCSTLATLLDATAAPLGPLEVSDRPFRVYNMAHVRGELHLSHFAGTAWLRYYYPRDVFIVRAVRWHVRMLRRCQLHALRDRSFHAKMHLAASSLFQRLAQERQSVGSEGSAAMYRLIAEALDLLARARTEVDANALFDHVETMLGSMVEQLQTVLSRSASQEMAQ